LIDCGIAINCFRLIHGFVDSALSPGGAVGYLTSPIAWHHKFKDTLYVTQEILGTAVAVCPLLIVNHFSVRGIKSIADISLLDFMEPFF
jgi:hypothetical protein